MSPSLKEQVPDLEDRISQLTAPNETGDPRFSGPKFQVNASSLDSVVQSLRQDLIVLKASGKLLLPEKERGEQLTNYEYIMKSLALLSQLGLNVFFIHGGQEQLDRLVKESCELTPEEKERAMLKTLIKNMEVRYTSPTLLPLVISLSKKLSNGVKQGITGEGGNANAYLSSLFVGQELNEFRVINPRTGDYYRDNCFGYVPIRQGLLRTIPDRETRRLRYLRGELDSPGAAQGHIVVCGFLVNIADPNQELGNGRRVNPRTGKKEDPYQRNGDADNLAQAHVAYFGSRCVVPMTSRDGVQLVPPKRVHFLEITRGGGFRKGPDQYDAVVPVVTSEDDLQLYVNRNAVKAGMLSKVRSTLSLARLLAKEGIPADIKIIHRRELLPSLLADGERIMETYGSGFGTTFAPGGLYRLNKRSHRRS